MKKALTICLVLFVGLQLTADAASNFKYYLTKDTFTGDQALTACTHGYHMASIFEVAGTSDGQYNTSLGLTLGDSGFGPPQQVYGWIRTGLANDVGINCDGWSTNGIKGVTAAPIVDFQLGPITITWSVVGLVCTEPSHVWCVKN
jgi:hypothetical protein